MKATRQLAMLATQCEIRPCVYVVADWRSRCLIVKKFKKIVCRQYNNVSLNCVYVAVIKVTIIRRVRTTGRTQPVTTKMKTATRSVAI